MRRGSLMALLRRRVFRIQVFGQHLRIVISRYQAVAMFLAAVFVYTGSLIEASTYNRDCTYMRRQVPGFSGTDVLIGFLLLLPCLVLVRKRNWRVCLAGTSAMLVMMSAYYFKDAFGPIACVNSGGMTDAYDAPGFCEIIVYAFVLIADYVIVLLYAMNRATVIVKHKYRTSSNSRR